MNDELFGLLGIDPKSAREKAFTRGLLSTIFNAAALSGPQARPVGGIQALGQLGLGAMEAYESSFDRTLKEALSGLQTKGILQQLEDAKKKRQREEKVGQALSLPTLQEQAQALQSIGAYSELKDLAESQRLLRRSGVMPTQGIQIDNPFVPYTQAQSPQVRQLADTYLRGFETGRIDEETADKRIADLAKMEEQFAARQESALDRKTAREVASQERSSAREIAQAEKETKRLEGTESQKLAAGFAERMVYSSQLIDQLENTGGLQTEFTSAIGGVPLIGGYLQRRAMTPEQQRYKQAADNWIRANLRKESGAVIGEEEMRREYETYFPMPGDDPATVEQKRQAREVTTQAMITNAGPVFRPQAAPKVKRRSPRDIKSTYGLE